jgi:hypothetical protein
MRRVHPGWVILAAGLILTACTGTLPAQVPNHLTNPSPTLFLLANSLPSDTSVPTTATSAPSAPTILPSSTFTSIPSFTPTAGTRTALLDLTGTSTSSLSVPTSGTPGDSVGLDELPLKTVFEQIRIVNNSGTQAEISLHCTTIHGLQTVLEYNNIKSLTIQAPQGYYVYVVYVGGKKIVGSFSFLTVKDLIILIYKNKVVIH